MTFVFEGLEIPDVILVKATAHPDPRGSFMEAYKLSAYAASGIPERFVQDNISHSARDVLRGLHYQLRPKAQGKLISVIRGAIFDVAVDIRRGSPTYGRWVGLRISAEDHMLLYVPVGFAHGFLVLSDQADVAYKVTAEYAPEADRGIVWNDPGLGIDWPIHNPILSPKDAVLPMLSQAENDFVYQGLSGR